MTLASLQDYMDASQFVRAALPNESPFGSETLYAYQTSDKFELEDVVEALFWAIEREGMSSEAWPSGSEHWLIFDDSYAGHISKFPERGLVELGVAISDETPFEAARAAQELEMTNGYAMNIDPVYAGSSLLADSLAAGNFNPSAGTGLQPGGLPTVESVNPPKSKLPWIIGAIVVIVGGFLATVAAAVALYMATGKKKKKKKGRR